MLNSKSIGLMGEIHLVVLSKYCDTHVREHPRLIL